MASNDLYTNEPRPRLCHLRRWPNYIGYGFNLHCDKNKPGQYIGKVDANSPAESAGLREHDRIIEVNYVPIGNENHKQVVARIKEGVTRNNTKYPEEVILLVLDPDADAYFKSKSIVVRSNDPNVEKLETKSMNSRDASPERQDSPIARDLTGSKTSTELNGNYKHMTDFTGPTVTQTKTNSPAHSRSSHGDSDHAVTQNLTVYRSSPTPSEEDRRFVGSSETSPSSRNTGPTLELKMSAAEYRETLKARSARKRDPRQDQNLSMKQKHALIDGL